MADKSGRKGIFRGDDPFTITREWLADAEAKEPNDPNAIALATVDTDGLPNVRMVLLKDILDDGFVFYTNYGSAKGQEMDATGKAAFVMHWKSLRRQVRARGVVTRFEGPEADTYFESRSLQSRLGAWASEQSAPLESRAVLMGRVAKLGVKLGLNPKRPPFWGGFLLTPVEIEFWADGEFRLHDRFKWAKNNISGAWSVQRLNP